MVFARFASDARLANSMLRIKVNPATIEVKSEICNIDSISIQYEIRALESLPSNWCHKYTHFYSFYFKNDVEMRANAWHETISVGIE